MAAVTAMRWWGLPPSEPSWPRPAASPQTLWRCVLLAVLLHVWLVVIVGNTQGGTAAPGQGVWGAINITLGGSALQRGPAVSTPPAGPVGAATDPRVGGIVREDSRAPRENDGPGAAREGQWRSVPTPAADALAPGRAPAVPAPQTGAESRRAADDVPAAPLTVPDRRRTALAGASSETPAAQAPRSTEAAAPIAPEQSEDDQPSAVRRQAPSPQSESLPAVSPQAAPATQPTQVQVQDVRAATSPAAPGQVAPDVVRPAPAPGTAVLGALPSEPDRRAQSLADPTLRPPLARLAPSPAVPVDPLRLADVPGMPQAALAPPERRLTLPDAVTGPAPSRPLPPAPLVAPPALQPPSLLTTPELAPAPLARVVPERTLPAQPGGSITPEVPALAPVRPLERVQATGAPAATWTPPATVPPGPAATSTAGPQAPPRPSTDTSPTGRDDRPPAAPAWAGAGVPPGAIGPTPNAGPDAGPVVGRDVATPPSARASAPLQLALPRGAAREIARDPPRGVLNLMPPPPERKSKLASDIEQAARKDCRDAYAGLGLLAPLGAAVDAARDRACKW